MDKAPHTKDDSWTIGLTQKLQIDSLETRPHSMPPTYFFTEGEKRRKGTQMVHRQTTRVECR